ncbi:MAG: hypothetical protein J7559_08145, partial [Cohnella sp.]|nr:hypothetical protein [Cohnella sp.]
MKRLWLMTSLALLAFATGCGSTTSSGRYITTEQSAMPSESASSQAGSIDTQQAEEQDADSPSTQVEPPL